MNTNNQNFVDHTVPRNQNPRMVLSYTGFAASQRFMIKCLYNSNNTRNRMFIYMYVLCPLCCILVSSMQYNSISDKETDNELYNA